MFSVWSFQLMDSLNPCWNAVIVPSEQGRACVWRMDKRFSWKMELQHLFITPQKVTALSSGIYYQCSTELEQHQIGYSLKIAVLVGFPVWITCCFDIWKLLKWDCFSSLLGAHVPVIMSSNPVYFTAYLAQDHVTVSIYL